MTTFWPDAGSTHTQVFSFSGDSQRIGSGSFQATAAGSTTVTNANIPANANIIFDPANAAAGLLLRSKTCSIATGNSAGSFVFSVSATGAGAPGGSETFAYFFSVENPN
jgi:hypothetical protein